MANELPGGASIPQPSMPGLPTFNMSNPNSFLKDPQGNVPLNMDSILKVLGTSPGSLTNTAIPSISNILGQSSQYLEPQIKAIRERGEGLAANAQSDAMARGLTGSDIEAAGMSGARLGAASEEANIRGQFGLQQAQTLAQSVMSSLGFDITNNKEMHQNMAQAIGQYMAGQISLQMFQEQMSNAMRMANSANNTALIGAGIGAVGNIASRFGK